MSIANRTSLDIPPAETELTFQL